MSKYISKFEEAKLQKEKFVEDFLADFDVWFEKNNNNKFEPSSSQIEKFLFSPHTSFKKEE